jgi:hypothetical protein
MARFARRWAAYAESGWGFGFWPLSPVKLRLDGPPVGYSKVTGMDRWDIRPHSCAKGARMNGAPESLSGPPAQHMQ